MSTKSEIENRINDDKLKFTTNIDLNHLFNLNYNFDLLKGIIEDLLKNQQKLQDKIESVTNKSTEKDKKIDDLDNKVKELLDKQIDKSIIEKINEDLDELKNHLKKHDDQIDELYDKLKKQEKQVESLENFKMLLEMNNQNKASDKDIKDDNYNKDNNVKNFHINFEKMLEMNKALEKKINTRLDNVELDINNLKDELKQLKLSFEQMQNSHNETNKKVTSNKEQIDMIFARLEDINQHYKDGDKELKEQIDDMNNNYEQKISELSAQLELLLMNYGKEGGKIGEGDLKIIRELLQKVNEIERELKEHIKKNNINLLKLDIEQLKTDMKNKADISIKDNIKKLQENFQFQIDDIIKQLSDITEKTEMNYSEIQNLQIKIKELLTLISELKNLNRIKTAKSLEEANPIVNINMEDYVTIIKFDDFEKEMNDTHQKFTDDILKLQKLIEQLFENINTKANIINLQKLEELLINKIEELSTYCNKKFADKNETAKSIKGLEQQIKQILTIIKSNNETSDNAILAKRPLNGFTCASCEAYIGDLKDKTEYIPWNKYPMRDQSEKFYRVGTGFSKMLQMLNMEQNNNGNMNSTSENNFHPLTNRKTSEVQTSCNFYYKAIPEHGETNENIGTKSLPKISIKNKKVNNSSELAKVEGKSEEEGKRPKM